MRSNKVPIKGSGKAPVKRSSEAPVKLKRALVEIAFMANDEASFHRQLELWSKTDGALDRALKDEELVDEVVGALIRMLQTLSPRAQGSCDDREARYLQAVELKVSNESRC